jgi:hypothetical protein
LLTRLGESSLFSQVRPSTVRAWRRLSARLSLLLAHLVAHAFTLRLLRRHPFSSLFRRRLLTLLLLLLTLLLPELLYLLSGGSVTTRRLSRKIGYLAFACLLPRRRLADSGLFDSAQGEPAARFAIRQLLVADCP